jgi:serine/threonine protein kinase
MRDAYSVEMLGHEVGNYRITGKIGQGGMGAVYSAEHTLLGRRAAIKVLLPEFCRNQEMVNRFFNEAKAATAIRHPGIVEIYDFGYRGDGSAYIVMEYLEGESLYHRMQRIRPLPVPAALFICSQISGVLAAAHAIGILHRDLKPDNIFLVPDPDVPGGERAKLLDFGIAKLTDDGESASIKTRTGVVMGSPAYLSAEQCKGAGQVRDGSDLYSVGCILYEMLCGEPPFLAEGAGEVIAQHIFREPVPLRQRVPHVGPAIDELVSCLLAKDPANRPRSAAELKAELDRQRDSMASPSRVVVERATLRTMILSESAPHGAGPTTTGSGVAGAVATLPTNTVKGRRIWMMVSFASALALAGGALALAKRLGDGSDEPAAPAPNAATVSPSPLDGSDVPAAPPSAPAPPPESAPSAMIKITIVSQPAGVPVYRPSSNAIVGVTPYELEIAPTTDSLEFLLKKHGYRDFAIEVPGNEAKTYSFKLKRLSSGKTRTPSKLDPFEQGRAKGKLDPFKK